MDFSTRMQSNNAHPAAAPAGGSDNRKCSGPFMCQPKWMKILFMVLLVSGAALAITVSILMALGGNREGKYVLDKQYQAVFLTNGQVYFGKITKMTEDFADIQDIYYLNSQSGTKTKQAATTSMSLVKLGCELHGPSDQMIINRSQVTFWENLSNDGKVVKAITQWKKDNPKGQTCAETSSSTTQSAGATTTTGASSSATTKP
jgi:hypothetical protein